MAEVQEVGRKTSLTSLRQISEINLTPLMDLTFILLITFIITFPLIEQGIPVDLPVGKARELSADQARTITLDAKGDLFLDDTPVSHDELTKTMEMVGRSGNEVTVMVRADEHIEYAGVVRVLKILHDARVTRLALVTRGEE